MNKIDLYVFAHWRGMEKPELMGILSAHQAKGRKAFSFEYNKEWLKSKKRVWIDPDIQFYSGQQFPNNKENFGVFLDSMPDTWGRTLMIRRAALFAKEKKESPKTLHEIDFLLGVLDETRMGAFRFKLAMDGAFLDDNQETPTPPFSTVGQLQQAVEHYENELNGNVANQWLKVLVAPGSSLGGARPKANLIDDKQQLWIAKFPSKNDSIDKGAWEFLAYQLALQAGISMSECRLEKIRGKQHTFFTKRFDRIKSERLHFSSAMTMTGNTEELLKKNPASYLDIAAFIQDNCANVTQNLQQLWRRIIFNIAISNTDDHLRNHGFLLTESGWNLSPAYDLNPSIDKDGLALNIDLYSNELDLELAISVGQYFRLSLAEMKKIIEEVKSSVSMWESIAKKIGIARSEQEIMRKAFLF